MKKRTNEQTDGQRREGREGQTNEEQINKLISEETYGPNELTAKRASERINELITHEPTKKELHTGKGFKS